MSSNVFADTTRQLANLTEEAERLRLENAEQRARLDSLLEEKAALQAAYESLVDATQILIDDRDGLRQRVEELEVVSQRLTEMVWGRRSERRTDSPGQQYLGFADEPSDPPSPEEQEVITAERKADDAADLELLRRLEARRKARKKKREQTSREAFPAHLPRHERLIDLPEDQKKGLKLLRVARTERLRFKPPKVYVEVIKRPEYVVDGRPEQGVKSEPPPLSIVPGCKYDFSVVAAVVGMKMAFHNPTYRQQDWFAQSGWFPSRSTCNDLIQYAVDVSGALYQQMWSMLLACSILLGDDTRVRVLTRNALTEEQRAQLEKRKKSSVKSGQGPTLDTGPPGSVTSYAWYYGGLDGKEAPYDVFHWSLTHQHFVIDAHLAKFRGIFVGDADGANARLEARSAGRIRHASCNTHARRNFVKAESHEPILASQALALYRQLYVIEERGKPLDAAGRLALRQRAAVPIWNRMKHWLDYDVTNRVLPKGPMGEAVGYLRNQWTALQVYLSDGDIPIDNDHSEQRIRPYGIGRNNWLFLGHPQAAPGRLQLYSIVSSANRHHLVVQDYLEDVLTKLADAQQNHPQDLELGCPYLLDLLPDRWAAAHPKSVRQERIEESERVWDSKRARRARARLKARQAETAGQ